MRKSTDSENLAALEDVALFNVSTGSDTPTIILGYGSAGNDAACEDPAMSEDDLDTLARDAPAADGLGDVATDMGSSARPTSYDLHRAARAYRSVILGEFIVAAIQAVGAIARRAYARQRQRRQATAIHDALRRLDDRALRDLGFDRSETRSVAAEVTGEAEHTRVRAITFAEIADRRYWTRYDHFIVEREARKIQRAYLYALAARGWAAARRLFGQNAAS
jgi:uncharacterized protein YjiS (DUF1127 family)